MIKNQCRKNIGSCKQGSQRKEMSSGLGGIGKIGVGVGMRGRRVGWCCRGCRLVVGMLAVCCIIDSQ